MVQALAETEGPRSKRAVILAAAIDSFGHDGYEHTKWAKIADEVGIGQTALYHYFESKAHCLLTIMSLELSRSLERFREVMRLLERRPTGATSWISTRAFLEWKDTSTTVEALAAQQVGLVTLARAGEAVPLRVARVTASYFDVFGVTASLGRTFAAGEDAPGNERVVVLSHAVWTTQFGADPQTVGRSIVLDDRAYTVIGVLPADSAFDRGDSQIWQPLAFTPANMTWSYRWLTASFGRLKPGVSLDQARREMEGIASRVAAENPDSNKGWGVALDRYSDVIVGPQLRTSLVTLLAAVGSLLLICCANLAGLVLVRAVSRQSDLAVHAALGASRGRLVQQILIEQVILATAGAVAGIGLAMAAIATLEQLVPPGLLPSEANVQLDGRVLVFAVGISAASGLVFGLLPALRTSGASLAGGIGGARRGSTPSASRRRFLNSLVIAELAAAFLLLCGAALLMRTFVSLRTVDVGFVSTNVLTMRLPIPGFPPGSQYASPEEFQVYLRNLLASVDRIPGVRASAVTSALPLTNCCLYSLNLQVANRPLTDRANRGGGFFKVVTHSYFAALGLALKQGRFLDERDRRGGVPAVVVNERLARQYFPGQDPIGQRILNPEILPGRTERGADVPWEIVGVVANEKISALNDDASVVVYASYEQSPVYFANLAVRATVDPLPLERSIRRAVYDVNRSQALLDVRTLAGITDASAGGSRAQALLMTVFSSAALVLAALGVYSVLAYSVALRTRELGIRTALGASAVTLLREVAAQGLKLTGLGLTVGMVAALTLTPLLQSVLYNVEPRDPYSLAAVTAILGLVALTACWIPARRAARVDPLVALRGE